MNTPDLAEIEFVAPILGSKINEAEVLGSAVWLWMHSKAHQEMPLHTLSRFLLPAIKHQQFLLAVQNNKAIFYVAWAWFNEKTEQDYLTNPAVCMPEENWRSGDRIWFLDWVAPFGHTKYMSDFLQQEVFANHCGRALYHRGEERGMRILTFRGKNISPSAAKAYFKQNVLLPYKTNKVND